MPPIPVYADKPLHGKDEVPQTADSNAEPPSNAAGNLEPTRTTTTTTAAGDAGIGSAGFTGQPPPPQPGARPTPTARNAAGINSTDNKSGSNIGDAPHSSAPQPGSRPVVTASYVTTQTTRLSSPQAPPPQFFIPPPSESYLPTRSTATAQNAAVPSQQQQYASTLPLTSQAERGNGGVSGTATANAGPGNNSTVGNEAHSLQHPPNYVQNANANTVAFQGLGYDGNMNNNTEEPGVWDGVKALAGGVGEKVAEAEAQAWKWIQSK